MSDDELENIRYPTNEFTLLHFVQHVVYSIFFY